THSQPAPTPPNSTSNHEHHGHAVPPVHAPTRTYLPPLTRHAPSPDPIPLAPNIAPPAPHAQHAPARHFCTTQDDHAATLMSVPLDDTAADGSDRDARSANTSRANSPASHLAPPALRPADSGTAEDDVQAKSSPLAAGGVDSAASVARLARGSLEHDRFLPYTVVATGAPPKEPSSGRDDDEVAPGQDADGVTDQITSHSWASTLSPHLLCGANLRAGLGVYIGVALVTHLVMLVDGIHFLLPNKGPFASLYNTSAPSQLTRDSLAFLRGLTITESIVLSFAILIGVTCGALGLVRRSHRLWAVYTFASIAHVLWNLVTSSLMIWVFPREFALAFTSAFMVLWLVATLVQIYAALCSYVELQVMRREAEWTARGQVVLRLA
ncbi:hypothetical protein BCR44DRAFT_1427388, partial [Catenaria anguillulae PL171]